MSLICNSFFSTDKRSNLGITVLHCGALLSFLFDSIPMETCGELGHAQRHKRVGCASLLLAVASGKLLVL